MSRIWLVTGSVWRGWLTIGGCCGCSGGRAHQLAGASMTIPPLQSGKVAKMAVDIAGRADAAVRSVDKSSITEVIRLAPISGKTPSL
jgi:hypothetical protein